MFQILSNLYELYDAFIISFIIFFTLRFEYFKSDNFFFFKETDRLHFLRYRRRWEVWSPVSNACYTLNRSYNHMTVTIVYHPCAAQPKRRVVPDYTVCGIDACCYIQSNMSHKFACQINNILNRPIIVTEFLKGDCLVNRSRQ